MLKDTMKFISVKIIILLIVTAILTICSLGLKNIMGEFSIASLTAEQNVKLTRVMLSSILSVLFYAYVIFITTKMKFATDDDKKAASVVKFALKETAVYAIYLLILLIIAQITGTSNINESFVLHVLNAQIPFYQLGANIIINFIVMAALYFVITCIARFAGTKKSTA